MDSNEKVLDNIYIESFWKTVKYGNIKFRYYGNIVELRHGLKKIHKFL